MFLISVTHPSFEGQHDIGGVDEAECLKALEKTYPDGRYKIVFCGWK